MAQKEGVELSRKQVISMPKKKLPIPKAASKAKSLTASISAKGPVLFNSHIILSGELQGIIDKKWDACWPVSTLRPLALLDLLCYLLFIKKLEEKHLMTASLTRKPGDNSSSTNELNWNGFKDMDAENLHRIFTCENGVPDLIKNYGLTNLRYSLFLKEPLLLTPSARLLVNMVDIIKIMDAEGSNTKAALFDYLLNKAEIETQNGQVYAPDKIVKLIIELMHPSPGDLIWDPSTGNGSLLVNSAKYIRIKNAAGSNNFNNDFFGDTYNGIECDPVQLRIGAMNMILNGIEDPKLGGIKALNDGHLSICEQSTLVLSNLFFNGTYDKKAREEKTSPTGSDRSEIHFLNLILKTLKKGGRGAVIVPEYILSNFTTEITAIRQQIIDDHKLAAVISLTTKGGSLFSRAGILIFSELKAGNNDKVWFYKMKPGIKKKVADSTSSAEICMQEYREEYDEVADIINRWKNVTKENTRLRTDNSFYVPIEEIKTNNYNLCFNEYRKIEKETQLYTPGKIPKIDKGIIKHISTYKEIRLSFAKIKLPGQVRPVIRRVSSKLTEQLRLAVRSFSLKFPERLRTGIKSFSLKFPEQVRTFVRRDSLKFLKPRRLAITRVSLKLPEQASIFISRGSLKLLNRFRFGVKRFLPYLVPLSLISVIVIFFYFEVFTDDNYSSVIATNKTKNVTGGIKPKEALHNLLTDARPSAMFSPEQIKTIVYDTTPVIHFDEQPPDGSISLENSTEEPSTNENDDIITSKSPTEKPEPETFKKASPAKYTVRDTTFFHDHPDERSIRKSYLDPLNNNVLNPIHDKNGFIYIVYTNHFGRTSKGWINKKDLEPLR
jgi:type I restriction enzyme M protein